VVSIFRHQEGYHLGKDEQGLVKGHMKHHLRDAQTEVQQSARGDGEGNWADMSYKGDNADDANPEQN
jgi:hypothetical protein